MVTNPNPTPQQRLGEAVRRLRLDAAYSQEDLADVAGLHRTYISQLEQGQRNATLGTLLKLSGALSTTCSAVLLEADL